VNPRRDGMAPEEKERFGQRIRERFRAEPPDRQV
jgi:hypothetical protein